MILQIAGGLMICAACAMLGLYAGNRGVSRAKLLFEFKRTLLLLKSEVEYAVLPLPQALENVARRAAEPFDEFYGDVSHGLSVDYVTVCEAWEAAAERLSQTAMSKGDLELFAGVGRSLGNIDAAVQLNAIDMAIAEVDDISARLAVENAKNVKLYRSLGILSGLLITVALL